MLIDFRKVQNVKQTLLIISILYFYGLAFAIQAQRETFGLDRPTVFLVMGGVFLMALFLEVLVTWWPKRTRIMAGAVFILAYALIGFMVAPRLFGTWVVPVVLLAPLALVFVGGFCYVYIHLFYQAFFAPLKLSDNTMAKALKNLPGWERVDGGLEKTFHVTNFDQALDFMHKAAVIAHKFHREPNISLEQGQVCIRLITPEVKGATAKDLDMAKEIDSSL